MKHDELSHIDGLNLFSELNVLKKVLQVGMHNTIAILNNIKKLNSLPNSCICQMHVLCIEYY